MKNSKYIFAGFILLVIGISFVYYLVYRKENKPQTDSLGNKRPVTDTVTIQNHEEVPIEMGTKPEANPNDGSVKIIEDFIKSNMKNPKTLEFLEWSEITSEDGYWKVRCKYTGVSSFNAEVTTNAWFYIRNNKVVYSKTISKI